MNTGPVRFDSSKKQWVNDRAKQVAVSGRGMFVPRMQTKFGDVLDGLSNTLMVGEIATDLGDHDSRTHPVMGNQWNEVS